MTNEVYILFLKFKKKVMSVMFNIFYVHCTIVGTTF